MEHTRFKREYNVQFKDSSFKKSKIEKLCTFNFLFFAYQILGTVNFVDNVLDKIVYILYYKKHYEECNVCCLLSTVCFALCTTYNALCTVCVYGALCTM